MGNRALGRMVHFLRNTFFALALLSVAGVAALLPAAQPALASNTVTIYASSAANVGRHVADDTWSDLVTGAGTGTQLNGGSPYIWLGADSTGWDELDRGFFFFDTSSIPAGAVITSATFKVYGTNNADGLSASPVIGLYGCNSTATSVTASDFQTATSTAMSSTTYTYSWWNNNTPTWVSFALNSAGMSSISTGGWTRFSLREVTYDVGNSSPPYVASQSSRMGGAYSGSGQQPELVITYDAPPSASMPGATASTVKANESWSYGLGDTPERHAFEAAGRQWVFYMAGSDYSYGIQLFSTADAGASWTDTDCGTSAYSFSMSNDFSSFCDGQHIYLTFCSNTDDLMYREGTPNSDGSVTWLQGWQTVATGIKGGPAGLSPSSVTADSSGHAFIAYANSSGVPVVTKNADINGFWSTAAGFPYMPDGSSPSYFGAILVPLLNGQVYSIIGGNTTAQVTYGQLYDPTNGWGNQETILPADATNVGFESLSAVSHGVTVELIYLQSGTGANNDYDNLECDTRSAAGTWTNVSAYPDPLDNNSHPMATLWDSAGDLRVFFTYGSNAIYTLARTNGTWNSPPTEIIDESAATIFEPEYELSADYAASAGTGGLAYITGAGPYAVRYISLAATIVPTVITAPATGITPTTAQLNGDLASLGTASSVDANFAWGTASGTYPETTTTQPMTAPGTFSATIGGLAHGEEVYYRAQASGDGSTTGAQESTTTTLLINAMPGTAALTEIAVVALAVGLLIGGGFIGWGGVRKQDFREVFGGLILGATGLLILAVIIAMATAVLHT